MKSRIILTTVLGASGALSTANHGEMSLGTWCVTYLSTYLVPVANPGRSTGASSLQPTFAGNSSVTVTQSQNVLTFDTSVITSDATEVSSSVEVEPTEAQSGSETESQGELTSGTTVIASGDATGVSSSAAIEPTQTQSGSETVSFDSTTGTPTDQITTSLGSTVSSDALTTSTGIIEPPGRSVIFLISAPDTRKRQNTDKGFVGDNNPSICSFAESFNFAENQLFENGVPFFYNGEDYKELTAGTAPPAGAVTRLFTTAGRSLQVDFPGGTAGFCQASDGRVYVTFASGPAGCEAVSLEVYDESQCQNGRLVGIDTTTSAIETTTSEGINSESATSVEGPTATETTALSSESIAASSSTALTQSVGPVSQTTESEVSTAASSSAIESIPSSSTTSIAVSDVSTLSPASSSVLDESTTDEVFPTRAPSLISTSVQAEESTLIQPTSQASSETTESGTTSSEERSSDVALETTTEATTSGIETTAVDETITEIQTTAEAATESETTTAETSVPSDETSTADVTSVDSSAAATTSEGSTSEASTTAEETTTLETTTAESTTAESTTEESTTQEPTTTAETTTDTPTTTTTSAAATTTAALTCADLPNPYTDSNGNIYNLACNTNVDTAQLVDQITTESFVDCMEACSGRSQCDGVEWESSNSQCTLINEIDGSGQSDGIDIAILQGF
ncbi:hypothetical protein FPHYL_5075 [Fusarium phyllophilum]|uniref:DUF7908 domain-containing protein n=1 Tax=Fusarium phyllophilum TaxID=47803 RepID=A0A8H5NEY3_9HYPO|nr:hypothetical protein FPHYL_5075 [Fusarium phyllophilum]